MSLILFHLTMVIKLSKITLQLHLLCYHYVIGPVLPWTFSLNALMNTVNLVKVHFIQEIVHNILLNEHPLMNTCITTTRTHCHWKKKQKKKKNNYSSPWLNRSLRNKLKKKANLNKKAKTSSNWDRYKSFQNNASGVLGRPNMTL